MPDPAFQIDGTVPVGFEIGDTKHALIPGRLTASRRERFPGQRVAFVIKGRALHPTIIVEGAMRALSLALLRGLITTYQDMQEDIPLKTVALRGVDYPNCDLTEFRLLTPFPRGYLSDGMVAPGAHIRVRFTFHQISA